MYCNVLIFGDMCILYAIANGKEYRAQVQWNEIQYIEICIALHGFLLETGQGRQ